MLSSAQIVGDVVDNIPGTPIRSPPAQTSSIATQTFFTDEASGAPPVQKPETIFYSIGIQTAEPWSPSRHRRSPTDGLSDFERDHSPSIMRSPKAPKRLSRREKDREDELRRNLRREVEEELKAVKDPTSHSLISQGTQLNCPIRGLTGDELNAVTSSEDFLDFVERSSKVIERALDQEYDVLANYALEGLNGIDDDEDEGYESSYGKKGRRLKEVAQFYDERWSKKRMISDINFSPKVQGTHF